MPAVGSRAQVWHGNAHHTKGGLTKEDLMMHNGRIVSRKKHEMGLKLHKKFGPQGMNVLATPFGPGGVRRSPNRWSRCRRVTGQFKRCGTVGGKRSRSRSRR